MAEANPEKQASEYQEGPTAPKTRRHLYILIAALLGLCVGAALYVLLHLAGKLGSMGQSGSNTAQIWSFIVAILELCVSVTAIVIAIWSQKKDRSAARPSARKRMSEMAKDRPRYIMLGLIAAILAFSLPPMVNAWAFRHVSSEDVTGRIVLSNHTNVADGDTVRAKLPATKHTKLKVTLHLASKVSTGSCVSPARMKITPTYNGSEGTPLYDVVSDTERQLTVKNANQPMELVIDVRNDPHCTVKLTIGSAKFFN